MMKSTSIDYECHVCVLREIWTIDLIENLCFARVDVTKNANNWST